MKLESFRVQNYRSINDSGEISVSRITALLGRNESGKSNLLKALYSLNPVDGFAELKPIKNFPRDRTLTSFDATSTVLSTTWVLDKDEKAELLEILPRATEVEKVSIGRNYSKTRTVGFIDLPSIPFDLADIKGKVKKVSAAVRAAGLKLATPTVLDASADAFDSEMTPHWQRSTWATAAKASTQKLRTALAAQDTGLTDKQDELLTELEELAESLATDVDALTKARNWVVNAMPTFIYVADYPELDGHQDIAAYAQRKENNQLTVADTNFEKLCQVAGLKPEELQKLLASSDHETRNQLANRASAHVTKKIQELWKDRPLKVRFNLDANHMDTYVAEATSTYEVEVNLNDRSRGFQWFFAFYISFAADTAGGDAENAVLLLDEPGLYLHAKSQADLLRHFEDDFENQILFSTHSPFMVPTYALDTIRTVSINHQDGTTVTNDPTGDARTLFPLQAALGYDLAQSLFVGPNNLVVEGVTDFWLLSSISGYASDKGRTSLDSTLTLTPAGGAQKISYMVALLTSESLNVMVLFDTEPQAQATSKELLKAKLLREQNVVFVSEALPTPPGEADIEDLLEPDIYEALVREAYSKELKGKTLKLNANIPRIAKRVEAGLLDLEIPFHKTRPTRLFLKRMASEPEKLLPDSTLVRFEALFALVNSRLQGQIQRGSKPFQTA